MCGMSNTEGKLRVGSKYEADIYTDRHESRIFARAVNQSIPNGAEAHARRLVACWNQCEGQTTEKLESDTAQGYSAYEHVAELVAQRDELLKDMEFINIASCYASEENTDMYREALMLIGNKARAAVEKAKGKA
jgi:hypothetical protein